jgi:C-terminal domain found in long catalases
MSQGARPQIAKSPTDESTRHEFPISALLLRQVGCPKRNEWQRHQKQDQRIDLDPSPALSLVDKAKPMLKGRKVGALVTDGADGDRVKAFRDALEAEGAELAIVAPKIGGVHLRSGKDLAADMALSGAPSVFFDAVAIFVSTEGIKPLLKNSAAID